MLSCTETATHTAPANEWIPLLASGPIEDEDDYDSDLEGDDEDDEIDKEKEDDFADDDQDEEDDQSEEDDLG